MGKKDKKLTLKLKELLAKWRRDITALRKVRKNSFDDEMELCNLALSTQNVYDFLQEKKNDILAEKTMTEKDYDKLLKTIWDRCEWCNKELNFFDNITKQSEKWNLEVTD